MSIQTYVFPKLFFIQGKTTKEFLKEKYRIHGDLAKIKITVQSPIDEVKDDSQDTNTGIEDLWQNPSDRSTITDNNTPEDYSPDFYRRLFNVRAPSNNDRFVVENIDISKQFYDF